MGAMDMAKLGQAALKTGVSASDEAAAAANAAAKPGAFTRSLDWMKKTFWTNRGTAGKTATVATGIGLTAGTVPLAAEGYAKIGEVPLYLGSKTVEGWGNVATNMSKDIKGYREANAAADGEEDLLTQGYTKARNALGGGEEKTKLSTPGAVMFGALGGLAGLAIALLSGAGAGAIAMIALIAAGLGAAGGAVLGGKTAESAQAAVESAGKPATPAAAREETPQEEAAPTSGLPPQARSTVKTPNQTSIV